MITTNYGRLSALSLLEIASPTRTSSVVCSEAHRKSPSTIVATVSHNLPVRELTVFIRLLKID